MRYIGQLSEKYESGNRGPETISSGKNDRGGKSYGKYQLASAVGTLERFLRDYNYWSTAKKYMGKKVQYGSSFDAWWVRMCKKQSFVDDQYEFIRETHYLPCRRYADKYLIPETFAINNVLWSIGVQHGGYKKIIDRAGIQPNMDEIEIINRLFDSRLQYTKQWPQLRSRYQRERKDALKLIGA